MKFLVSVFMARSVKGTHSLFVLIQTLYMYVHIYPCGPQFSFWWMYKNIILNKDIYILFIFVFSTFNVFFFCFLFNLVLRKEIIYQNYLLVFDYSSHLAEKSIVCIMKKKIDFWLCTVKLKKNTAFLVINKSSCSVTELIIQVALIISWHLFMCDVIIARHLFMCDVITARLRTLVCYQLLPFVCSVFWATFAARVTSMCLWQTKSFHLGCWASVIMATTCWCQLNTCDAVCIQILCI